MKKVRDHYFKQAKREGFAARSAYKLAELDKRFRLLRPGARVLDLGCAPGSWLQYAAQRVGTGGRVVGVDLQPVSVGLPAHATALQGDVFAVPPDVLDTDAVGFDVVLSDMAPRTSGVKSADAARSAELVRRAIELAGAVLRPSGALAVKLFQGAQLPALRESLRSQYARVTVAKPKASRAESVEVYLVAQGRHAGAAATQPE